MIQHCGLCKMAVYSHIKSVVLSFTHIKCVSLFVTKIIFNEQIRFHTNIGEL